MSQDCQELKRQGNQHFIAENYVEAEKLYSKALDLTPNDHLLLGNRSAARLKLGKADSALVDATKAVEIAPEFTKGYHRKAQAEIALGKLWVARSTYESAFRPGNLDKWLLTQLENLAPECKTEDWSTVVQSLAHWQQIFKHQEPRVRLASMAHFWNSSAETIRLSLFKKFLSIVSNGSVSGDEYKEDQMKEFPMENYSDIRFPETWDKFYDEQPENLKMELFVEMFDSISEQEKDLIIKDMRVLFQDPAGLPPDEVAE